jgi:peptidoglycan/LPS O-acetylase OafA/YrhL
MTSTISRENTNYLPTRLCLQQLYLYHVPLFLISNSVFDVLPIWIIVLQFAMAIAGVVFVIFGVQKYTNRNKQTQNELNS